MENGQLQHLVYSLKNSTPGDKFMMSEGLGEVLFTRDWMECKVSTNGKTFRVMKKNWHHSYRRDCVGGVMEQILLYHYSTTKYSELKTREAQGAKVDIEVSSRVHRPGNYNQHISFFMDPIPAKTMTSIFGAGHPVWFNGNRLVEHVIDLGQIGAFKYHVVETPEKTAILYDNGIDTTEFYRLLNKLNLDHGYIGEGVREFMKPYKRLKGH